MKKGGPTASGSSSAFATPSPVSTPPANSHSGSPASTPAPKDDLARRVAEAKRRVAEAQSKLAVKDNPYMVCVVVSPSWYISLNWWPLQSAPQMGKNKKVVPVEPAQQGAGLKMAAHPLLLDNTPAAPQSKKDRYKPMQPKFASIKVTYTM